MIRIFAWVVLNCFTVLCLAQSKSYASVPLKLIHELSPEMQNLLSFPAAISVANQLKKITGNCQAEHHARKLSERFLISFSADESPCRIYDLQYPSFWHEQKNIPVLQYQSPPRLRKITQDFSQELYKSDDGTSSLPELTLSDSDATRLRAAIEKLKNTDPTTTLKDGIKFSKLLPQHSTQLQSIDLDFKMALSQIRWLHEKNSVETLKSDQFHSKNTSEDLNFLSTPEAFLDQFEIKEDSLNKIQVRMASSQNSKQISNFGAATLLDYSQPHKLMLEIVVQQVTSFAATRVTQLIPDPLISTILSTAIGDLFRLIQLNHFEQLYHLEAVLRQHRTGMRQSGFQTEDIERGLDLLYAHRNQALWDWAKLGFSHGFSRDDWYAAARNARTGYEDYAKSNRLSSLANLKGRAKCELKEINEQFALCSQNGVPHTLFSLTQNETFAHLQFGPKILYSYKRPWQVSSLKGFSWALSSAVRILNPFERINFLGLFRLSGMIAQVFSSYSQEGLREQAIWWQHLNWARENELHELEYENIRSPWLRAQSLNPFNLFRTQY